jgi:hypothetical protein
MDIAPDKPSEWNDGTAPEHKGKGETYLRRKPAVLEESQQIRVLAVNVAADLDGSSEFQQHGLRHEDLPCLVAQAGSVLDGQIDGGPRLSVPRLQELIDHSVDPAFILGGPHRRSCNYYYDYCAYTLGDSVSNISSALNTSVVFCAV